ESVAKLDAYVQSMLPRLAYVADTRFMREMLMPSRLPFSVEGLAGLIITRAAVDLLPREHQDLYGYRWPQFNRALVGLGSALAMGLIKANAPYEKVLPELRAQSAVHAFGGAAKRQRANGNPANEQASAG
ncbi:MAG TPA: oxygenase MpaB family protein, partial [Thermomicrobiales bacterium]|nr:oxygenase MpaB family protein [Thermomicrobiales bacterium]